MRRKTLEAVRGAHRSQLPRREAQRIARAMIAHHYNFVIDFGRLAHVSDEALLEQIESIEGLDRYDRTRAAGGGLILATAHLGVFETAMLPLTSRETRVHVVFKRDALPVFEQLRSRWHERVGVVEAPVDDGPSIWPGLRTALRNDEVVLMQCDRVLPGQKGVVVPFLGGRMEFPTGPVRLALLSGAALMPVFALRLPSGGVRIVLEEPLLIGAGSAPSDDPVPFVRQLATIVERQVREHLEQWFVLGTSWRPDGESSGTALSP